MVTARARVATVPTRPMASTTTLCGPLSPTGAGTSAATTAGPGRQEHEDGQEGEGGVVGHDTLVSM